MSPSRDVIKDGSGRGFKRFNVRESNARRGTVIP